MAPLIWLVTGCTSGIGLALVHSFAARGDKVIATGRGAQSRLAHLKSDNIALLDLDVTAPLSEIQSIIAEAVAIFGRIDVLVNNAGKSRMSSLEEASVALLKTLFDVNLFGAMKTTQAVLPHMCTAKTGTVVFIGAGLGWVSMPFLTPYSVTKASLTMFAEGLQKEIAPLGLRSLVVEPGRFVSDLAHSRKGEEPFGGLPKIEDYVPLFTKVFGGGEMPKVPGDIAKLPGAIIDIVKGEGLAKERPFPVRVLLGSDSLDAIRQKCNEQLQLIDSWEDITLSVVADGCRETSPWLLDNCSILPKSQ
ncbi:hypothetical protein QBC35DRAFT_442678 [Podospora australis]|uniref:Oxidoreductase n=1 Tax=Podospora australis TaxID=1536484 RepID=A0AAN6WP67_9PEZI|nr:hypothetical protein QBC35DRAFT_442678 [Podospora australis]